MLSSRSPVGCSHGWGSLRPRSGIGRDMSVQQNSFPAHDAPSVVTDVKLSVTRCCYGHAADPGCHAWAMVLPNVFHSWCVRKSQVALRLGLELSMVRLASISRSRDPRDFRGVYMMLLLQSIRQPPGASLLSGPAQLFLSRAAAPTRGVPRRLAALQPGFPARLLDNLPPAARAAPYWGRRAFSQLVVGTRGRPRSRLPASSAATSMLSGRWGALANAPARCETRMLFVEQT